MKKRIALLLCIAYFLSGCPLLTKHSITFDEVSKPYLDQYGPAEQASSYISADYSSVDWWWWTKGFEVTFVNTTYDDVEGWKVYSTYSFAPIP